MPLCKVDGATCSCESCNVLHLLEIPGNVIHKIVDSGFRQLLSCFTFSFLFNIKKMKIKPEYPNFKNR